MQRTTRVSPAIVAGAAAAMMASTANAGIIISNLDGNDGTQSAAIDGFRTKAMGFTINAGIDQNLKAVTLRLETFGIDANPLVQIWSSDSAGGIGAPIADLVNPALAASGIANYNFSPAGTLTLQDGVNYWLVVSGVSGTPFDWKASDPAQTPVGPGAVHTGALFGTAGLPPDFTSGILNSYAIDANAVPAPGATAVLAMGGLLAARRRR